MLYSVLLTTASVSHAQSIDFDADANCIRVVGFPEAAPATVTDMIEADARGRWGKIKQHKTRCEIRCNVVIGIDDGSETWFRWWPGEARGDTLRISGNWVVHQPKAIPNQYRQFACRNGLLLGKKGSRKFTPRIEIECPENGAYAFNIGDGTRLEMRGATIAPAKQDGQHKPKCTISTRDFVIDSCTFAEIHQLGVYELNSLHGIVRNCVFDGGDLGIYNGDQYLVGCTFRNLKTAIQDGGALTATLVGCTFEDNERNFLIGSLMGGGIVAIDCKFAKPKEPDIIQVVESGKRGRKHQSLFAAKRHLVFQVRDVHGQGIRGAQVLLRCEQRDLSTEDHCTAMTDSRGHTPPPKSDAALLVTDYVLRATGQGRPRKVSYTYVAKIQAPAYQPILLRGIDPDPAWLRKRVTLRR